MTLLQALFWQAAMPPWTAPDEPGHFLYAQLIAETRRIPTTADITPERWRTILNELQRSGWQLYIHPNDDVIKEIAQEPALAASGRQVGRKPPGYYVLAAAWMHLYPDWQRLSPTTQLRWMRLLSLFFRLLAAASALVLGTRLWPDIPMRAFELGLMIGLLPMVGFIGDSVNNDAMSLFWGALSFTALLLTRSPSGWVLTLGAIFIGPVFIDRSLLFLWPLVPIRLAFFQETGRFLQWSFQKRLLVNAKASVWIAGMGIVLIILTILLISPNPRFAAGWRHYNAQRTRRAGQLYLRANGGPTRLFQILSGKRILKRQGQTLTLQADVSGTGDNLLLKMTDDANEEEILCPLTPHRQICTLSFLLTPQSDHLYIIAQLSHGEATFKLTLTDETGWQMMNNGQGRMPAPLMAPVLTKIEQILPLPAGYFSRFYTSNIWDAPSLVRYGLYIIFTWASFWGYFGWLSRPYPWFTYLFLAGATVTALWGLLRRLRADLMKNDSDSGILIFSLFALLLILLQTWTPMLGGSWQPQGRYLFPALLPIAILLTLGWEALMPETRRQWLPWLMTISLVFLDLQAWRIVEL